MLNPKHKPMTKKILICCTAMLMLVAFGCKKKSDKKDADKNVLSKNIEYDVTINNYVMFPCTSLSETNDNWYNNNIEASVRGAFLDLLFKNALSGKLKITDMNNKSLDSLQLRDLLSYSDTVTNMRSTPPFDTYDTVIKSILPPSMVTALRFRENWIYDPVTMAVTKKVIAIAPVASTVSVDKEGKETITGHKPLFWIVLPETNASSKVLTKRIVSTVSFAKDPMTYCHNIDAVALDTYMQKLVKLVYTDSLSAYAFTGDGFPNVSKSGKDWENLLNHVDTIRQTRTEPPYGTYDTIVKTVFKISAIRFLEEWAFDPATMAMEKKIVGVCPVEECYDMNHEFKGYRPIFWIYFSDVWTPFDGKLELKKAKK